MVNTRIVFSVLLFLSAAAKAQEFQVAEAKAPAPTEMQASTLYYSYRTQAFSEWKSGTEKELLNLFPGFRDHAPKGGGDLVLFIAKTSAVINKPASEVNLEKLRSLPDMQKLQSELARLEPISVADLISNREDYLAYKNPGGSEAWCSSPESLCLKSTFIFTELQEQMLAGAFFFAGKDASAISAESQVKVLRGEAIPRAAEWAKFTGVSSAPTLLVTEDMFWFSHVLEFGKVVGVVQAHPTDPSKSILTGYTVFAIEKKWWEFGLSGVTLQDAFLGRWMNGTSGLSMGLPKVTQQLFRDLLRDL